MKQTLKQQIEKLTDKIESLKIHTIELNKGLKKPYYENKLIGNIKV